MNIFRYSKNTCPPKCKSKGTSKDSNRGPLRYRSCIIRINQTVVVHIGPFYGNGPGLPLHFDSCWDVWDRDVVNDGIVSCGTSAPLPLPHIQSLHPPAQLQCPKIAAAIPPGHEHGRVAVGVSEGRGCDHRDACTVSVASHLRPPPPPPRDAFEGEGPQRWLGSRLEEVAKAVGGGYCRLQMPLRLAFTVRETAAGHRLGALEAGGGGL